MIINNSNRAWGLDQLKRTVEVLPQRILTFASTKTMELIRRSLSAVLTATIASNLDFEILEMTIPCLMQNANRVSPHMLTNLSSFIIGLRHLHLVLVPGLPKFGSILPQGSGFFQFVKLSSSFPTLASIWGLWWYRSVRGICCNARHQETGSVDALLNILHW